jgi:AcrR family transcriptional regulator
VAKPTSVTRVRRHTKLAPGSRLPPEVVRESQRERLMIALVDVVDHQGLPASTVADLVERAHVSRVAFYEQFASLEDCFLTTVDTHNARVGAQILSAYNTPGLEWPQRVRAGAQALQRAIDTWPAAAQVCLADILTAGTAAGERHEQAVALVRQLLREARAATGERGAVSKRAAVAVTGGLRGILRERLREEGHAEHRELDREIESWLLACLPLPSTPAKAAARRTGTSASTGARGARTDSQPAGALALADSETAKRGARIVGAVAELAVAKGYRNLSHRDIASQAKVSYKTFYNHFESKQEAMLAACEAARERLIAPVSPALASTPERTQCVRSAIDAFLHTAAESQLDARLLGVEAYNLGHPGLRELDRLAADLRKVVTTDPPPRARRGSTDGRARSAADAFAGAAIELLRHHATTRRLAELPQAGPELVHLALAPLEDAKDLSFGSRSVTI